MDRRDMCDTSMCDTSRRRQNVQYLRDARVMRLVQNCSQDTGGYKTEEEDQ
jgi:hypothetical protein